MMANHSTLSMPTLGFLLEGMVDIPLTTDLPVSALRIDSRLVQPGDLFIALEGLHTSGTRFVQQAQTRGAAAILVDTKSGLDAAVAIPVCRVPELQSRLGLIASRFFGDPSRELSITGITGTNGKTSIAYYLAQAFSDGGKQSVGSIGTLGYGEFGSLVAAANTTPDAITLQQLLYQFRSGNIRDVVMEVSSHALDQGRVNNVLFNTAVFSNLSRDHLDYHGDMSGYAAAKRKLFMTAGLEHAVINADDPFGTELLNELAGQLDVVSYGLDDHKLRAQVPRPTVEATITRQDINSLILDIRSPWGSGQLYARLAGKFNSYNLLASLAVLCLHKIPFEVALHRLSAVVGVPGRMEFFGAAGKPAIFVDYAHTPDALQQALMSLRNQCAGKLVCVFGCGGDRDQGKRPQMGNIAERHADRIILTSDNPRSEAPEKIMADILAGMTGRVPVELQADRVLAIRSAIASSDSKDIVLIAGKGHETYQEIMGKKLPFSDRQLVRNLLGKTA